MSTIINVKTDPKVKSTAQKIASELGLSLSSVINAYLREFIRTKTIRVSLETPSEKLKQAISEAKEELERGKVVSFDQAKDAIDYLDQFIKKKK